MKTLQKVQVFLNKELTGEGILLNKKDTPFRVSENNVVVKITKRLHPIAKKGIFQFDPKNVKFI
jgi:hypothetical protein